MIYLSKLAQPPLRNPRGRQVRLVSLDIGIGKGGGQEALRGSPAGLASSCQKQYILSDFPARRRAVGCCAKKRRALAPEALLSMADTTALERTPNERTAWIVVCAIGFCLLAPWVLLRGMSLDGLIYATVARNMAVGLGDFWHPLYDAKNGVFHEHPPLGYALQSTFFRVLGDHWWVDRLYSVLTAVPMAGLMVLIWRRLARSVPRVAQLSWLAVMLWIVMPAWLWIYRNNYLENTLGIFTALAVYASLRALDAARWWPAWSALAAASIVAAVLCKGPVGLFPAVTPMLAVLALGEHSPRKGLLVQASLVVGLAALAGLVLADPAVREFLAAYLDRQVFTGWSSSFSWNSSFERSFKTCPFLSRTVANTFTTFTPVEKVGVFWASVRPVRPALS